MPTLKSLPLAKGNIMSIAKMAQDFATKRPLAVGSVGRALLKAANANSR